MADVIMKIDDLDGTPIAEGEGGRVEFSFEGKAYEIDLTNKHRDQLAKLLEPFISKAAEVAPDAAAKPQAPIDPDEAMRLALEEIDREKALQLQAEAEKRLAAGELPYEIPDARLWLEERGIEFNEMGPLKEEFRVMFEKHYGLPSYSDARRAQRKSL